jgi:GT2 family glycosyltransferase
MSDLQINKKSLSIIIINYNLAKEIENCLESLSNKIVSNQDINFEVIIVDNNSPDKELPLVEKKLASDTIKFYYLDENVGFGKGCNYGFSKASGKYICFLNPDTLIKEDIFSHIISQFENDKSIGIIGPKQQVREPLFDFSAGYSPNIIFEFFNLFGLGIYFEGFLISLITKIKKNKKLKVKWILGAAIFIKSELFKEIGGFDKDYFMFFEELDLCKRVANQKLKIIYCPEYRIHHIGSVSGKKDYTLYTIRTYISKNIYLSKHYKYFYGFTMKFLLRLQVFSQIIIWCILSPVNKDKSIQKLKAFFYLLKNNMNYEHRNIC